MNFNNNNSRLQDISKVVDTQWKANHNYNSINQKIKAQEDHFNRMFNIQSKDDHRKEMRYANSVEGKVQNLNERMQAMRNNRNGF